MFRFYGPSFGGEICKSRTDHAWQKNSKCLELFLSLILRLLLSALECMVLCFLTENIKGLNRLFSRFCKITVYE